MNAEGGRRKAECRSSRVATQHTARGGNGMTLYRLRAVCCVATRLLAPRTSRLAPSLGISLIEVLMSMFVLLFGLMGVAALFPVGNFYLQSGEKHDLGSSLAQSAFEDLQARGLLRPENWLYGDSVPGTPNWGMQQTAPNKFTLPIPSPWDAGAGPGHAFVLDPLGVTNSVPAGSAVRFPMASPDNPWGASDNLAGFDWPVRRMTLPVNAAGNAMTNAIAETIFRLRDDLAVEQPEEDDRPAIQRWEVDNSTAPPMLVARQYQGNYSWLATVVPTSSEALDGLQPSVAYDSSGYDVSVVVFRKRDEIPSAESKRLIDAELLLGGELAIYANTGNPTNDKQIVDAAVDGIRPGEWICVMGVHQSTGVFLMKWYRLLSLDDETDTSDPSQAVRRAMLSGPDWPINSVQNLKVALLPDVISVVTRSMPLE